MLEDTADLNGWVIKEIEADKDHVHLLIEYPSTDSISGIFKELKQKMTFYMWKRYFSYSRRYYWKNRYLWNSGYFYCSIGRGIRRDNQKVYTKSGVGHSSQHPRELGFLPKLHIKVKVKWFYIDPSSNDMNKNKEKYFLSNIL